MIARAVPRSSNRKLTHDPKGKPVAATYAAQSSCPKSCPFLGNGCYAESDFVGFTTRRLNLEPSTPSAVAKAEAAAIGKLPTDGRPLRLHVVGDARTAACARTLAAAVATWQGNGGGGAWTYTHAWRSVPRNAWGSVSVLASLETAADAGAAGTQGYAVSRVTDRVTFESLQGKASAPEGGVRWIPCPAQTSAARSCADCRLCMRADSLKAAGVGILFGAHGAGAAKIEGAL